MISANRNLLIIIRNEFMTEQAIETEVRCLNHILSFTESSAVFCNVHELVDRYRITNRPNRILSESQFYTLRPFRFLVNKN